MEAVAGATLGRIRIAQCDFERLGHDGWWMHEKCMGSADMLDYSVMMMPVPSGDDVDDIDATRPCRRGNAITTSNHADLPVSTPASNSQASPVTSLPEGWEARQSTTTGAFYYVCMKTLKTQWYPPADPCATAAKAETPHMDVQGCAETETPVKVLQAELQRMKDMALTSPGGVLVLS